MVSVTQPRQDFIGQRHYGKVKGQQPGQTFSCPNARPDTMGENNTQTALKVCGVKIGFVFIKTFVEMFSTAVPSKW